MRYLIAIAALVPSSPQLCLTYTVMESRLCPGSDTHYVFIEQHDCEPPVEVFNLCTEPVETEDFAPEPLHCDEPGANPEQCIEPGYDEHDPEGPGPGPPGAGTVDRPG